MNNLDTQAFPRAKRKVSGITEGLLLLALIAGLLDYLMPRIGPIRIVEILLLLLTFCFILLERRLYLPKGPYVAIIGGFTLYPLFASLIGVAYFAPDFDILLRGIVPAVRILAYSIFFWIGYNVFRKSSNYFDKVIYIILVVAIANTLYGTLQFTSLTIGWPAMDILHWPVIERLDGTSWTADSPTGFTGASYSLATLGLITVAIGLGVVTAKLRLGLPLIIFGSAMVFLSWRRSQLIYMTLLFISSTLIMRSIKTKIVGSVLGVLTLSFLAYGDILFSSICPQFSTRLNSIKLLLIGELSDPSLANWYLRVGGTWQNYIELSLTYPFGTGLYPPNFLAIASDNAYLTYLVWGGPLMLLLYLLLLASSIYLGFRLLYYSKRMQVAGICLIMLTTAHSLTDITGGGVMSLPHYSVYWLIFAYALATYQHEKADNRKGSLPGS